MIEVDGPIHEEQADYDAGRDQILRQRGLTILRFTNEEVRVALDEWLRRVPLQLQKQPLPSPLRSGRKTKIHP